MHYSNIFKPLPYEESLRTIYPSTLENNKIGVLNKFVLPNIMINSITELIKQINALIEKSIGCTLSLMGQNETESKVRPTFFLRNGTYTYSWNIRFWIWNK